MIDQLKKVDNGQEADFLAVGQINALEVEYLGINLADKKIYQLIDKANKANYYYD